MQPNSNPKSTPHGAPPPTGDGVPELAVGGDGFPSGEFYGSVWVLFLRADGSVKRWRRIDELDAVLQPESLFGGSIDTLGDLDGACERAGGRRH